MEISPEIYAQHKEGEYSTLESREQVFTVQPAFTEQPVFTKQHVFTERDITAQQNFTAANFGGMSVDLYQYYDRQGHFQDAGEDLMEIESQVQPEVSSYYDEFSDL